MGCKRRPVWERNLQMSDPLQAAEMPQLDAFDEEFGQDSRVAVRGRRRKIMVAIVALCAGAIAALAFAWSSADGRLRLELQSITPDRRARGSGGRGRTPPP